MKEFFALPFRTILLVSLVALAMSGLPSYGLDWDLESDTWAATDALSRSLPDYSAAGAPKADKSVGMFYFLWHEPGLPGPYDITQILQQPTPTWGGMGDFHHWGQPELGYYTSVDEYVLRKHAQMLSDAGVDALFFDVSNGYMYPSCYLTLCKVFRTIRNEGGKTPQIAFLCPFGNPATVAQTLYDQFYSQNMYGELWYRWNGKPIILANPSYLSTTLQSFFTCRRTQPSYFSGPGGANWWGWLEKYPQHSFYDSSGACEEVAVGVAQNCTDKAISQMSVQTGVHGRSWHNGAKDTSDGAVNYGYNFAEQWSRALALNPKFVFVTGWNEWTAQRQTGDVFWDEYNQEYSRDIEPMKGGHTDNYYYQLIDNVRRYKGVRKAMGPTPPATISMDGDFSDWTNVEPEYRDTIGDAEHRNSAGWGSSLTYINNTGRNDIVRSKVARDSNNIYFYVETSDDITPYSDPNWMMLFINSDCSQSTGWNGYDYLVNFPALSSTITTVKANGGGWTWNQVGTASYRVSGNKMEIAIPRSLIGQTGTVKFDFHWADSIQTNGDIATFFTDGDSAPNRRFNYRYDTSVSGPPFEFNTSGNLEGWQASNSLGNMTCTGSTLSFDITGADPYTIGPRYPDIDANEYRYIHIRMKSTAAYKSAQLFWGTLAQPYHSADRCVTFSLAGDSDYHDYYVDMASNSGWSGLVNQLRLDPSDSSTGHIDIDFIRFLPDIFPPSGSIRINGGASATVSTNATLALTASDTGSGVSKMRFSNDGVTWSAWEDFGSTKSWSLTPGDGTKTVYAQLRDRHANRSATLTSTIITDTIAPTTPGRPVDTGAYSSGPVTFTWAASTDSGSGISGYNCQIGTTPGGSDVFSGSIGNVLTKTIPGTPGSRYYCRVQAKDNAGNLSPWSSASDGIYAVSHGDVSIADAKALPIDESAGLHAKVVTAMFSDVFYIQEADRPSAIMVRPIGGIPAGLTVGATVDVGGAVRSDSAGQRWVDGLVQTAAQQP